MLIRHLVISLIIALSFTASSHAYVRSGSDIYFLTSDKTFLPMFCLYELKDAFSENYESTLSRGSYGNVMYASIAHHGERFEDLLKIVNDGDACTFGPDIRKGTRQDYRDAALARRSGDQYQIAAFEELDAAGLPFTLKAVDELAKSKAPRKRIDLTQARPVASYRVGQYVLNGAIERYRSVDKRPDYVAAYEVLFQDYVYRYKTAGIKSRLVKIGDKIRSLQKLLPSASYFNQKADRNQIAKWEESRTRARKELEAREPDFLNRGNIQNQHVEDMKARFLKFQEPVSELYRCPEVPVLD